MMKYNDGKRKVTMKNKRKKGVYWKKFFYLVVVSIACTGISGHALRINGEKMTTILKTQNFKVKAETASKTTKALLGQPKCITVTAVKKKIVITWEPLQKVDGYEIYEAQEDRKYKSVGSTTKSNLVLSGKNIEKSYYYYVRAYVKKSGKKEYGKRSKIVSVKIPATGTSTIKNFLRTAMAPVGSTMYVWGGGWNKADTGAGTDAKHLGVCAAWRKFSENKTANYNYKNYRYQIHNGLDCSGFVGWSVYNVLHTKNGEKGYVYSSKKQAKQFSKMGFGTYKSSSKVKNYKPGDIMSSDCNCCGHVWIVIGACKDGSVVLLHSSPAGVQISGTVTPNGKKNSEACKLAKTYMKKYYASWYRKFPRVDRGSTYLKHYGQMRWKTTGKNVILSDPEGYKNMSAKQILKDLFDTN